MFNRQYSPPLSGIRIIDLTRNIAGPYLTMTLADLGAEVWKVESPEGDETRKIPPIVDGQSLHFISVNRGKASIALDLKKEYDRSLFLRMIKVADVVVDNFRIGVMERLGIGYDRLRSINPQLITCSITGFGRGSPYQNDPAFDLVIQAMSGVLSMTSEEGQPPFLPPIPVVDILTGLHAGLAILSGLLARLNDRNCGRHFEVSLFDTQLASMIYLASNYLATGEVPKASGAHHRTVVPYGNFRTRDKYLALCVVGENAWNKFCKALGFPPWTKDPRFSTNSERLRHKEECISLIEKELSQESALVWVEKFRQVGVPAAVVRGIDDALADPHLQARDMLLELSQQRGDIIRVIGSPIKGDVGRSNLRSAPRLDEDRFYILNIIMDQQRITDVRDLESGSF